VFVVVPLCTVACAVAVVTPGMGTPVTLSVYVPAATSLNSLAPFVAVNMCVSTSISVFAGTCTGPEAAGPPTAVVWVVPS
jgi:hypothetical protein